MRTLDDVEIGEENVEILTKGICPFSDRSCDYSGHSNICTRKTISISRLMRKDQCNSYSETMY